MWSTLLQYPCLVLTALILYLPVPSLSETLLDCYSCTWDIAEPELSKECQLGDAIPVDNNYISSKNCLQCFKQEGWRAGKLESVIRSCFSQKIMKKSIGCVSDEDAGKTLVSCTCDSPLCNTGNSHGVAPLHQIGMLLLTLTAAMMTHRILTR